MRNNWKTYPPTKTLAVDVDGTLHDRGLVNENVVSFCRRKKEAGFYLILWSARGAEYATQAAKDHGVEDIFDVIISKPGFILDDQGWSWIKFTEVIRDISEA